MKKQTPALTQPPVADNKELPPEESEAVGQTPIAASGADGDRATDSEATPSEAEPLGADRPYESADRGTPSSEPDVRDEQPEEPVLLKAGAAGNGGSGGGGGSRTAEPSPKGGKAPLVLAVLALIGVVVIGWQVYELRLQGKEVRQEVAQRLSSGDGAVAEIRALNRQNQDSLESLQGRFGALESQVAETAGQAASLQALYQEFSRSRSERALAEVEQAISIAAQQLHLAGNFEAALIALRGAEARLSGADQGHMQALRKALLKDIDELESHPQVDVPGLALRLELLLERIDQLPLAYSVELAEEARLSEDEPPPPVREEGADEFERAVNYVRAFGAEVWNEVRSMVRLERMDEADPVLLSPAQSTYLRENVKIRLLTARLALLARDGRTYSSDLAQAREWIERFFDTRDAQVTRATEELAELEGTQIAMEAPSLNDTFSALRRVQSRASDRASSAADAQGNGGAAASAEDSR